MNDEKTFWSKLIIMIASIIFGIRIPAIILDDLDGFQILSNIVMMLLLAGIIIMAFITDRKETSEK